MARYRLTEETRKVDGHTLHRVEYCEDFRTVRRGMKGGFVERLDNIKDEAMLGEDCAVYGDAVLCGKAQANGHALVYGSSIVCGDAIVSEKCRVHGHARVYGHARIGGQAQVAGHARVRGKAYVGEQAYVHAYAKVGDRAHVTGECTIVGGMADLAGDARVNKAGDYIVFHNFWDESDASTTWTRSNDSWKTGAFCGSAAELAEWARGEGTTPMLACAEMVAYVERVKRLVIEEEDR